MSQEVHMHQVFHEPSQPEERRWSAVVPPQSALTFAVVWDSEGDIVSFSGAQLEASADDSPLGSPLDPLDVNDAGSRLSFYGPDNLEVPRSETSSSFFSAVDRGSVLPRVRATPLFERIQLGKTQTSSTLGGLDVYLKGSVLGQTHIYRRRYTYLEELGGGFEFDPTTSYAKLLLASRDSYDEGEADDEVTDSGCEAGKVRSVFGRPTELEAHPYTISPTNGHCDVDSDSVAWSRLDPPRTPGFNLSAFLPAVQPKTSRRLRKRRPNPPPPNGTCRPMPKCLDDRPTLEVSLSAMFRCKPVLKYRRHAIRCEDDGSWVCVEAPAVVSSGCL